MCGYYARPYQRGPLIKCDCAKEFQAGGAGYCAHPSADCCPVRSQPTVAIDYTTRGLLAEGMPLLGMGYFTSGYDVTSHREVATTIKELQRTAAEGFTMVQIYRLGEASLAHRRRLAAAALVSN